MNETNPFYQASVDQMYLQINYLQELIGRELLDFELDNMHEFYSTLDPKLKDMFESRVGPLV